MHNYKEYGVQLTPLYKLVPVTLGELKAQAYILSALFIAMLFIEVYVMFIGVNQFAYDLSRMPREQAYAIVYKQYQQQYQDALSQFGYDLDTEAIRAIFDDYMEQATELKWYEIAIASQSENIKSAGYVITPCTIIMLTILYFKESVEN